MPNEIPNLIPEIGAELGMQSDVKFDPQKSSQKSKPKFEKAVSIRGKAALAGAWPAPGELLGSAEGVPLVRAS